jgi:hypothetical protein
LNGKTTKLGQCKCYVCRKPFAVTVGTVMESSHIPLHVWLQAMHLMCGSKEGISNNQLHRTLGVALKSAWSLSHRIREMKKTLSMEPMGGEGAIVEAEEFGRNEGTTKKPGHSLKRAATAVVERDGGVSSFHVGVSNGAAAAKIVAESVPEETIS